MTEVKSYILRPTELIPNSHYPLLHYPSFLANGNHADLNAVKVHDLFMSNGWNTQWIFRYGSTQRSHYHSQAHECMAVLSGSATIRFGVADTTEDLESNTYGPGYEDGGIELQANAGDVFIIPAGVSHKTFNASPAESFKLLTPGDGHKVASVDVREALAATELTGFTMIGAYPSGGVWDFAVGGENIGQFEDVWAVRKPERDPVLGDAPEGICGLWV